ncbi:MAG: RNA polymerase factor sigma-54, partial [Thermodesulfobacteriota bacterium]
MALELKQELKLGQHLVMTPQLQMAIKFLQLSRVDLLEYVQDELQQNPVLEEASTTVEPVPDKAESIDAEKEKDSDVKQEKAELSDSMYEYLMDSATEGPNLARRKDRDDVPSYIDAFVTTQTTLIDHLLWQLHLSTLTPKELEIGEFILGNLNEDGYLKEIATPEIAREFNVEERVAEEVLVKIQGFDPLGVGARNLKECLFIQARFLPSHTPIVEDIIERHLSYLETKDYSSIALELGVAEEMVEEAVKIILGLDPKPGRAYGAVTNSQYVIPDVFIEKVEEDYVVTLNDDGLPKLKINHYYRKMLKKNGDITGNTKDYLQNKLQAAFWLIKSIHQRQATLLKITRSLIGFQREFLDKGLDFIRPLILKDVADDVGVHESTVSRVTTNKYASTPQGVIELKSFFRKGMYMKDGSGVLCNTISDRIQNLVASENPAKPLSDRDLVRMLRTFNIDMARRTVAKYRER